MAPRLRLLVPLVAALAIVHAAAAAQSNPPADDSVEIPGGIAPLARALGLDPSTAVAARIVVDFAHAAYSIPDGQADNLRALAALRVYFDAIEELTKANAAGGLARAGLTLAAQKTQPRALDVLGLALTPGSPDVVLPDAPIPTARRELLERAGIDVAQIADDLNRGRTVKVPLESAKVPLPLGNAAWTRLLARLRGPARPLFRAIFEDRSACLLYTGLAALDPPTRAWIAGVRGLDADLYQRAAIFGGFARALRVAAGTLAAPGGADAAGLWEAIAGEPPRAPDAFVRALFSRENGRLAYFFDVIDALDEPHQRYALGLWMRDPAARLDRFRKLAGIFTGYDESWHLRATPFARPSADPSLLLRELPVPPDGSPPRGSRAFWTAVFADESLDEPSRALDGESADAAWLLARAFDPPIATRRERMQRMLFTARRLASPDARPEAAVVAAHGFARFPALMLTLERMHVTDLALYADAARRAAAIDNVDGSEIGPSLMLFQGSLAIVERARFAHTLSDDTAAALVRSLVAVRVQREGYAGAIARWFDASLLPALADGPGDADRVLIRALAGRSPSPPATLNWEGTRYRVDVAESEVRRIERLRRDQRTAGIADVLALARAAKAAEPGATLSAALAKLTVDHDPAGIEGLRDLVREKQRMTREASSGTPDRARLTRFADHLLAYSLLTLIYAAGLGDADADPTTVFDPNLGDRHDFGRHASVAWTLPQEESGVGDPWHLQGSMLGLDAGLGRFALRRLSTEPPSQAPQISSNDRQTFAETVALLNPYELRDEDMTAIGDTIARGRERAARLAPADLDAVAGEVALGAWDREAIRWTIARDRAAGAAMFTLGELFWLGAPPSDLLARIDAWGMSARPLDGALRLRFPRPTAWETFSGRASVGALAARSVEMNLRVACALAELKLPAALARGVISAATLDLVDEAPLGHRDDRRSVAHFAEAVTLVRIQDYVSFLTVSGPLIPMPSAR